MWALLLCIKQSLMGLSFFCNCLFDLPPPGPHGKCSETKSSKLQVRNPTDNSAGFAGYKWLLIHMLSSWYFTFQNYWNPFLLHRSNKTRRLVYLEHHFLLIHAYWGQEKFIKVKTFQNAMTTDKFKSFHHRISGMCACVCAFLSVCDLSDFGCK